jgi:hypothetical protein
MGGETSPSLAIPLLYSQEICGHHIAPGLDVVILSRESAHSGQGRDPLMVRVGHIFLSALSLILQRLEA